MKSFQEFADSYYKSFVDALQSFDREPLYEILGVLDDLIETKGILWVAGNGGSAAISDHAVCDLTKWTHVPPFATLRCISLTSNVPMITALGNDLCFDDIFKKQLEYYLKPDDAVLLVSSSGNSSNVVRACEFANEQRVPTIAFVGFKGGKLGSIAKHVVWVPIENYGIVEDTHQSLMHVLTQFIRFRAENDKDSRS